MANQGMTRRGFIRTTSAQLAAVCSGASAGSGRRPDVLFVLADDLRPDGFASLGNPVARTPNFDAEVQRGFVFRRAYTMGSMVPAVCMPSRTMLLTGRSLFHAVNAPSGDDPATYTLPRVMKQAGYAT